MDLTDKQYWKLGCEKENFEDDTPFFQNKLRHHGGVKVFLKSHFISQESWRTSEIYWSIALCTKLRESINVLHEWIFIPNFFHIKARKFEARHFLFLWYSISHSFRFSHHTHNRLLFLSKFQMFHFWINNTESLSVPYIGCKIIDKSFLTI